jgi:hypothetical protein
MKLRQIDNLSLPVIVQAIFITVLTLAVMQALKPAIITVYLPVEATFMNWIVTAVGKRVRVCRRSIKDLTADLVSL